MDVNIIAYSVHISPDTNAGRMKAKAALAKSMRKASLSGKYTEIIIGGDFNIDLAYIDAYIVQTRLGVSRVPTGPTCYSTAGKGRTIDYACIKKVIPEEMQVRTI